MERTCLAGEHRTLGASMVDFHGWEMPVRYRTSIPEEHLQVRRSAGVFDLSHMGRLEVTGKDAREWLQRVITNDYDAMKPGDARYTLILNEGGTVIDDAIVYRVPAGPDGKGERILLVVNASNRAAVIAWMEERRGSLDARLIDRSPEWAMIAVQGPETVRILPQVVERLDSDWAGMKYYSIAHALVLGKEAFAARTGYTGEDGFEIYLDAADAPRFWRRVLEIGGTDIAPIGLGARDTLRLEAGMPLYGHELDLTTDPFEAGLDFAVKLEKTTPFSGRERLRERKARGPSRRLRGFRLESRRVPRQGMKILHGGKEVGVVTSGAPSPTLGCPIAMGYLSTAVRDSDHGALEVDVRGNLEKAVVVPLPFYSRTRKKS